MFYCISTLTFKTWIHYTVECMKIDRSFESAPLLLQPQFFNIWILHWIQSTRNTLMKSITECDPIWKRTTGKWSPTWHLKGSGWVCWDTVIYTGGNYLSDGRTVCCGWHFGRVTEVNTHDQWGCVYVSLCVYVCHSSKCVGVRALAGGEPKGSGLIPAVIGFWSGPCSSVSAN